MSGKPGLTDAQIYTLRRMNSGRGYLMRGDGKKADEKRPDASSSTGWEPVNAPSIPVLYRLGLVGWTTGAPKESTKWYNVTLTPDGVVVATTAKISTENEKSD